MYKAFRLLLLSAIFTSSLWAQNQPTEPRIKASDPTLLYTQLNVSGGIDFIDYAPDHWTFNFGGTWAIKEKFSFAFQAPISNNAVGPSLFENISLNAAYQIHNNSGIFNSSLLRVGLTTPVTDDSRIGLIAQPFSTTYEFRVGYTAGIKVNEKLSLFPRLTYYRRFGEVRETFMQDDGTVALGPVLSHQGLRSGLTLSYDFNAKNFVQLGFLYSQGVWDEKRNINDLFNATGNVVQDYNLTLRYQHAFTPHSQIFLELHQQFRTLNPKRTQFLKSTRNLAGFSLGYSYFLD